MMGVSIYRYVPATITEPHMWDPDRCYELDHVHVRADYSPFPQSFRGLVDDRCYLCPEGVAIWEGSGPAYGEWRDLLCRAALAGIAPKQIWASPDDYRWMPFYEIIEFTDQYGFIGPAAAADLADDFRRNRDRVLGSYRIANLVGPWATDNPSGRSFVALYDAFADACTTIANTGSGLIKFA